MINKIKIDNKTRDVKKYNDVLGILGENKFETLKFTFDEFLDGIGVLAIEKTDAEGNLKKYFIELEKGEECYLLEVKNSLLDVAGEITMQLIVRKENYVVFKSLSFTMTVVNAIEATEEISDEYKTWDTILAEKILEINKKLEELNGLEDTLDTLLSNANLQVENVENLVEEATRLKEETEKLKEQIETALSEYDTKTDEKVSEFISTYNSKIEELNTLATNLTDDITSKANSLKTEFDENAEAKTTTFNSNVETKTNEFNENAKTKLDEYNSNDTDKVKAYNQNHESKMKEYNDNSSTKTTSFNKLVEDSTNTFNSNVEEKTTEFNNNVTEQTNTFNQNVTTKKAEINTLAEEKQTEINNNATAKINEFNENAESYEKRIAELETENSELVAQMPWKTTEIQESIHVEDSAKYSKNKLDIFGNLEQETSEQSANFIKLDDLEKTLSGVTVSIKDNKIVLNGTSTSTVNQALSFYSSKKSLMNNNTIGYVTDGTFSGNGNIVIYTSGSNLPLYFGSKTGSRSYTEEVTISHMNLYFEYGSIFENYTIDFTVVEANTLAEPIPFTPAMPSIDYPSMPITATGMQKITKCGKNYLDIKDLINGNTVIGAVTGKWLVKKPNTTYVVSTNMVSDKSSQDSIVPKVGKPETENAFIFVTNNQELTSLTSGENGVAVFNNVTRKVTTDSTGKIFIGARSSYKGRIPTLIEMGGYVQLEESEKATDYESYNGEDITLDLSTTELCKITDSRGNVVAQDRAVYRNVDGVWKWQWYIDIPKIVIDGVSANRKINLREEMQEYDKYTIYLRENVFEQPAYFGTLSIVSNLFKTASNYGELAAGTKKEFINKIANWIYSGTSIVFSTESGRFKSVEEANEYLANNNLIVYGKRYSIKYEDCTESQAEVLDKLYKLSLEKGTNNIFVESENGVTTELQLTYMQDNNLLKEQEHQKLQTEINTLKEAILSLGGNV